MTEKKRLCIIKNETSGWVVKIYRNGIGRIYRI